MKISSSNKKEFLKQGWTQVDIGLSKEEIKRYKKACIELRDKAIKIKYPLRRCYYSHISNSNVAAIESPLNKEVINQDIKELFKRIKLGKALKDLFNWNDVYLQLARFFTMRKYHYLSNWHFDFPNWDGDLDNIGLIQVAIYLQDQDGFRIIKPNYDLSSKNDYALKDYYPEPHLPLKLPREYYSEIQGKAGSVLFFAPGLLHQGNSHNNRLDFHFRFSNQILKDKNYIYEQELSEFYDFKIPDFYSENFNSDFDMVSAKHLESPFLNKLINSMNYYTCFTNFAYQFKYKIFSEKKINKPWKINLFANTIYQEIFK